MFVCVNFFIRSIDFHPNCIKRHGQKKYHMLSGSILSLWAKFKNVLETLSEIQVYGLWSFLSEGNLVVLFHFRKF